MFFAAGQIVILPNWENVMVGKVDPLFIFRKKNKKTFRHIKTKLFGSHAQHAFFLAFTSFYVLFEIFPRNFSPSSVFFFLLLMSHFFEFFHSDGEGSGGGILINSSILISIPYNLNWTCTEC